MKKEDSLLFLLFSKRIIGLKLYRLENLLRFSFILLCIMSTSFSFSQDKELKIIGVVTDTQNNPLPGVSVLIKGTSTGVVSNLDGKYVISIPNQNSTLIYSYTGFAKQEIAVKGKRVLNVILKESVKELNEVIVVGYGAMKKRDITGSIASITSKSIEERNAISITDVLQGQMAGIEITSGSGAPGEGSDIRIRGTSTFEGGVKPLFVVDGVPFESIDDINPSDIESIEVLKDAASAAIYGSRSANGVILISTKQGEKSRPRLDIRYLKSFSTLTRKMPKANGAERRYYDKVRQELTNGLNGYNIKDSLAFFNNQDIDLQDLIFRTASRDQLDLSASGASDKFKYYVSAGLLSDKGIIQNSSYTRITTRINGEYKPNKYITLGSKLHLSIVNKKGISEDGVLNQLLERPSYWAIFNPDGSYVPNISSRRNPYAVMMDDVQKNQNYKASIYEYLEVNFNSKFKFNTNVQGNFILDRNQSYRPSPQLGVTERTTGRDLSELNYDWANENYFSYVDNFKFHNINVMVGNSIQGWARENMNIVGLDYTTDMIYTLNAASLFDTQKTYTRMYRHSMTSFFGRAAYNYKSRYLVNANIRTDGSSRFGSSKRWGVFPSASIGWRFSDERFMRWSKRFLSDGKLRASWGITGNQEIGDYDSWQLYSPNYIYEGVSGIAASNLAYNGLSWEETTQYNIGLDLQLFNSKVRIVADYYKKDTEKLLCQVEVPKETGFTTIRKNVGSMSNEGFEFSLDYDVLRLKDFSWSLNFNIAHNTSRIKQIADGVPFYKGMDDAIYVQPNSKLGEFYGYKYLGIYPYNESNAYTKEWNQLTPEFANGTFTGKYLLNGKEYTGEILQKKSSDGNPLKGGDVDYVDINGDGIIDVSDKTKIGCAQPDVYGGLSTNLSYKGISLYISFYYSLGGDIYNYAEAKRNKFSYDGATPSPDAIANMWTGPGDIAKYPAPINKEHNRLPPSSFYIEDASYIKLRNVKLSYSLPKKWINTVWMKAATIYVYGNNLLTFTNYKGYDPEFSLGTSDPLTLGIDQNRYPRKREYGLGVNVTF